MDNHPVSLVGVLQGLVRVIAAVAGAVVGIGTLAFSAGFLAQRAQYEFAQVPFVFVDYWAYAEIGLMALVRSINLFVAKPTCLLLLGLASIVLVLAMESERFRRLVLKAHWNFLGYLVLILWLGVLLRQQIVVRQLRTGPVLQGVTLSDGSPSVTHTTVPVRFPFSMSIPDAQPPPSVEAIRVPRSSTEVWERVASDLESETPEGAVYLEVRPRPSWAILSRSKAKAPVLGVPVDPERLDAARAEELYRVILSAFILGVWGFVVLAYWQKRVYSNMARQREAGPPAGSSRVSLGLFRLREELWFSSRWILQGISGLLLVTTGVFLIPECYGLLALPKLGQEYVEVISAEGPSAKSIGARQPSVLDVGKEIQVIMELLNRLRASESPEDETTEWRQQIASLEADGSAKAAEVLRTMADASRAISSDLSDLALESLSRVASNTSAEGFILYYPRSETEYLRVLQRNSISTAKRWTIHPVKMADIVEIRVKRAEGTIQLIKILREMSELDPEGRRRGLAEAERLGHGRLLEVAIGGTYDPSHQIRGFSITDIGRFAAGLPVGEAENVRRQLAARRLLEILRDPTQRSDHRAAAATALHMFVPVGDASVCDALIRLLDGGAREAGDPSWQVRGTAITTAGKLRCRAATPRLLALVRDTSVPVIVRGSIPSTLIRIGTQENSARELGELLNDLKTPAEITGTALTAVSLIEGNDTSVSVRSLERFLLAATYSEELKRNDLVSDYRATAIDSLRQLGNPACIRTLTTLAERQEEKDEHARGRAVIALGEFQDPKSEALLIRIVEDEEETLEIRRLAIEALQGFHEAPTVRRLVEVYSDAPTVLRAAIVSTLRARGRAGSSFARTQAKALVRPGDLLSASAAVSAETESSEQSTAGVAQKHGLTLERIGVGTEMRGTLDDSDTHLPDDSLAEAVILAGAKGQTVTVDLVSTDFDSILTVGGPGLETTLDDDSGGRCNSRLVIHFPESGDFVLGVSSSGPGRKVGAFVLRVSVTPPPPMAGPCDISPVSPG